MARETHSGQTIAEAIADASPAAHGLQRLKDEFDIEEVVAEHNIMRACIHDLATRHGVELRGEPFQVINRIFDHAIGQAVRTFATEKALGSLAQAPRPTSLRRTCRHGAFHQPPTMTVQDSLRPMSNSMRNPWLKKNPLLSLWLSGANAMAGSIRVRATAQARRQAASAATRATNDLLGAWTRAMTDTPAIKKIRRG